MKVNKRNRKGISLIVLVITIIIMIILAGAIILSLNSSGVIGKANKAKTDSDIANIKELISTIYADYTLSQTLENTEEDINQYVKNKLKEKSIASELINRVYVAEDGKVSVAIIPEGFVSSSLETEDEVTEGLVIYEGTEEVTNIDNDNNGMIDAQETRNQFVWVPVPNISEFIRINFGKGIISSDEDFDLTREPLQIGDKTEVTEFNAMMGSVKKYGGFYVARYEAGKEDNVAVSKKGADIWNKLPWGKAYNNVGTEGAVYYSRKMYNDSTSVTSTLCYGVQWDAIMIFLKNVENPFTNGEKYIYNSKNMGWQENNYQSGNPEHKTGIDVDTNSSNKVKNIYDLAGNTYEWTMEAYNNYSRVRRGGNYSVAIGANPAAGRYRDGADSGNVESVGFRVTLFLK